MSDVNNWSFAAFILSIIALVIFMLVASHFLGGRTYGRHKHTPFESGALATGSARLQLSAKFYLVSMLFVIFEIEALFLFAWAVSVRESGWAGLIEATIFVVILLAGLFYLARIGALDWSPRERSTEKRPISSK